MLLKTLAKIVVVAGLVWAIGCGIEPVEETPYVSPKLVNNEDVSKLIAFAAENPEVAASTLKVIQEAAGANLSENAMYFQESTDAEEIVTVLEESAAQEAQELIENVLNGLNIRAKLDAGIQLVGLMFNGIELDFLELGESDLPEDLGGGSIFDLLVCDEFMQSPLPGMSSAEIESLVRKNQDDIKQSVNGCEHINLSEFLNCIDVLDAFTSTVNNEVTCSINSKSELENVFVKSTGKNFDEIQEASDLCINEQFRKCGFEETLPQSAILDGRPI